MITDVVIIGGGVAGTRCAGELSQLGFNCIIVEKNPYPGGNVARYSCKATDQCQRCGACLLEDQLQGLNGSERITWFLRTDIAKIQRSNSLFELTLTLRPPRIFPDLCNQCGKCFEVCPVPNTLSKWPLGTGINLNEDMCLFFRNKSCTACAEVCSEGAINLNGVPEEAEIKATAVILACGFKAFDPHEKPRFGYGRIPGVITGLELESLLRTDNFGVGNGDKQIKSVAFVQCVGSRDPKIGRNYCSRVCCGYAFRLAELLRYRFRVIHPTVFFMDIQSFDRDFESRLKGLRNNLRLVRSIPAEIRKAKDDRPELVYRGMNEERIAESFDLVVLSVGMSPDPQWIPLAELLGVKANQDSFLGKDGDEVETDVPGVFVAGAVQGPRSIEETVSHSIRTVGRVAAFLSGPHAGDNQ